MIGVVIFPGTNCEADVIEAFGAIGVDADLVWHRDRRLPVRVDAIVLPGGFAHGDYLRAGALARFSPIMNAVSEFAAAGGPVLGICNGFQILCEAGLLPGALQKNASLRFCCQWSELRVATAESPITRGCSVDEVVRIPINHFEGNYTCSAEMVRQLNDEDCVVLRYVDNPNGSIDDIAGVCSRERNVVGLMPHPERASSALLGGIDGLRLLRAFAGVDAPHSLSSPTA